MIVFQGFGFLAPILMVLGQITAYETLQSLTGAQTPENTTNGLGMLLAAPVVWLLGRWLNRDPGRALVDTRTGEQVRLRNRHTLFFLAMEWWGVVLAVLGTVLLANGVLSS